MSLRRKKKLYDALCGSIKIKIKQTNIRITIKVNKQEILIANVAVELFKGTWFFLIRNTNESFTEEMQNTYKSKETTKSP